MMHSVLHTEAQGFKSSRQLRQGMLVVGTGQAADVMQSFLGLGHLNL